MGITFREDLHSRVFNFANSFTIAKNAKVRTDKVVSLTAAWGRSDASVPPPRVINQVILQQVEFESLLNSCVGL